MASGPVESVLSFTVKLASEIEVVLDIFDSGGDEEFGVFDLARWD